MMALQAEQRTQKQCYRESIKKNTFETKQDKIEVPNHPTRRHDNTNSS